MEEEGRGEGGDDDENGTDDNDGEPIGKELSVYQSHSCDSCPQEWWTRHSLWESTKKTRSQRLHRNMRLIRKQPRTVCGHAVFSWQGKRQPPTSSESKYSPETQLACSARRHTFDISGVATVTPRNAGLSAVTDAGMRHHMAACSSLLRGGKVESDGLSAAAAEVQSERGGAPGGG